MNIKQLQERLQKRIEEARNNQKLAESNGDSDYHYWEGYLHALDYADDLLIILEE
jgi:hypothetical protein